MRMYIILPYDKLFKILYQSHIILIENHRNHSVLHKTLFLFHKGNLKAYEDPPVRVLRRFTTPRFQWQPTSVLRLYAIRSDITNTPLYCEVARRDCAVHICNNTWRGHTNCCPLCALVQTSGRIRRSKDYFRIRHTTDTTVRRFV